MHRIAHIFVLALLVIGVSLTPILAQTVELTHIINPSHHETHQQFVQQKAREFERMYPNVKIDVIISPGDYVEKVLIATAGGTPYDIIEPTSVQIATFAAQEILTDLRPYFDREGASVDDFIPVALLPFTWNDQLLCLPSEVNTATTITNVRLLQEAGLSTPQQLGSNWNWDALTEMAPKLSGTTSGDGSDRWAILLHPNFNRVFPVFVHNAGGDAFDAQVQPKNSMFVKDPAVREGLQFYADLYTRGWLSTDARTFRSSERTAINLTDGSWWIGLADQMADPFEYEVAPYPAGPARQAGEILANGFCMSSATKEPDWVWQWLTFLTMDFDHAVEYMNLTGRTTAYLPATPEFVSLFAGKGIHPWSVSTWVDVLTHPDARIRTVSPVYSDVSGEFNRGFMQVINETESLANFLEHMDRFTQVRLDASWEGK